MAKLQAPVHPDVAAEQANSAIEDGEGSEIEKYIKLRAECKRIAIQIHPSYKEQYKDVSAMMSLPPAIVNLPIAARYLFMAQKKETFKAMKAKLEGQSMKDRSTSAIIPSCEDPPFQKSRGRRELHQVKLRRVLEKERKKELQGTPGQKTTNGS